MKKLFLSLALGFGGLFAVIVLAGLLLPKNFEVVSSLNVKASPNEIHELVCDLSKWPRWAPWTQDQEGVSIQIGKISKGVGASQTWQDPSGGGRLVITFENPDEGIQYDIFFDEAPEAQIGQIAYTKLNDNQTQITWVMKGRVDAILGGILAAIFPSMVRPMFDKGLIQLKDALEQEKS